MRRNLSFLVTTIIIAFVALGGRPEQAHSETNFHEGPGRAFGSNEPAFAPGRILVKADQGTPADGLASLNRKNGAHVEEKLLNSRLSVVRLPEDLSVAEAVERYEASPNVEYAEPDYELHSAQSTPMPDDPRFPEMYNLNNTGQGGGDPGADIDAPAAWSATTGRSDTVVAVIDTGIDIKHPDLDGNVWTNPDEVSNNRIDDDKNGYVDDVHGWDFYNGDSSVSDDSKGDWHGTHVAGTIAAEGNNGTGVSGISWGTKVMPLKFIGPDNVGYVSGAVAALEYAISEGVKISNNSYGFYDNCSGCYTRTLRDAIGRADQAGHLFVVAAMNGGSDSMGDDIDQSPAYPASYDNPNIVAVAASDQKDMLTSFSNYGASSVDLAAPGTGVLSTTPNNSYGFGRGTSMATPHVAGVAALVKSKYPDLDDAGIKTKILSSVDQKAGLLGKMVTGGRLNAAGALGVPPNTAPEILNPRPTPGAKTRDRTPTIRATVRDAGTGLSEANIMFYVDGRRVTAFSYNQVRDKLVFTPKKKLSYRRHGVEVIAQDAQGLEESRAWKFRVVR